MEDLICPITLEYLEMPITLPCCGKAVSKMAFLHNYNINKSCPLCRRDLSNTDVNNIPMSVNLAYLVDKAKNSPPDVTNSNKYQSDPVPTISINKLVEKNSIYKTVIGQMKISGLKQMQHLVLMVVDKSGSMAGNPIKNVQYSLERILDANYKNPHITSHIITYDTGATSFEIDLKYPVQTYRSKINLLCGSGGTSFSSAFGQIYHICQKYFTTDAANQQLGGVSIIFLTDGEDQSSGSERTKLVETFRTELSRIIKNVPYVVHTVGFGQSHDFNFLNQLKDCGSQPGAYRYADPSENTDILSSKINSILDVVVATNNVPVKILESTVPVIAGENDTYWLNLTNCLGAECKFRIAISMDSKPLELVGLIVESSDPELWNQWFSHLIDDIADEVLALSKQPDSKNLSHKIHFELVRQRSKAIMVRCSQFPKNVSRLEKILEMVAEIEKGNNVNILKITDIKYEGKFETKTMPSSSKPTIPTVQPIQSNYYRPVCRWTTIDKPMRRWKTNCDDHLYKLIIEDYSGQSALKYIRQNKVDSKYFHLAASYGKISLIQHFVDEKYENIADDNGFYPCDLALLNGYWISAQILIDNGYYPGSSYDDLFRSCLDLEYVKTAKMLIDKSVVSVTDDMIQTAPYKHTHWLKSNSSVVASTQTMINQGMYAELSSVIDKIGKDEIKWSQYLHLLDSLSDNHIQTFQILIDNGKLDPHQIFPSDDDDITWPFFIACKKGSQKMFNLLLKYQTESTINMQNKKGTTVLWIACCNRHVDIVMSLLMNGADPNISNFKGDSALIPAIQKNSDTIVQILLESGIKMSVYNKNRDTPIIICCRLGQSKILEMCLNHLSESECKAELSMCADIDGFNPLLAAAEQNRTECIVVCKKFGADLEFRTANNNEIIPGATSLHVATHYNNLASVKLLCEFGANPESKTLVSGHTCLHIAIKQKFRTIISYLVSTYPQLLTIPDNDDVLPITYAKASGNEEILEEFFLNKLELLMSSVVFSDKVEPEFYDVITKYSTSLGCYEHDKILNLEIDQHNITKMAILSGKNILAKHLLDINECTDNMTLFWNSYMSGGHNGNAETQIMLDRINKASANGVQNKLLLNLPKTVPKMLTDNKISVIDMMTTGYNDDIVNPQTLSQIRNSATVNHSLLGFLEKLKNNKVFPDGKEYLEYIVWNAKVHMTELIACGESILQPVHIMAIYLYSSNATIYSQVNCCLAKWSENEMWQPFVHCLYNGISLCPLFTGEVYRAVNHKFEPHKYTIGKKITSGTFTVTSSEPSICNKLIEEKRHMIFIIKSLTGRNISPYSKYMINREVVFLPGTEFTVTNIYVGNPFVLSQANIRKNYVATETDIIKGANSQINIIVELQEIGQ